MGWFSRQKPSEPPASLVESLANALGTALGRVFEAQAHQIEQSSKFLDSLQDLSARKAAQIMGSRGGKISQERKRAARRALSAPECALCENPLRRDVSVEMVRKHREHGEPQNGAEPDHIQRNLGNAPDS